MLLSLLVMPVTYRGGAEQPHPHVFFQLWIDAAHGSFDHHGGEAEAASHSDGRSRQATPGGARASPGPDGPTFSVPTFPEVRGLALVLVAGAALAVPRAFATSAQTAPVHRGRGDPPLLPPPRTAAGLRDGQQNDAS
jgi:hypothetical protein